MRPAIGSLRLILGTALVGSGGQRKDCASRLFNEEYTRTVRSSITEGYSTGGPNNTVAGAIGSGLVTNSDIVTNRRSPVPAVIMLFAAL